MARCWWRCRQTGYAGARRRDRRCVPGRLMPLECPIQASTTSASKAPREIATQAQPFDTMFSGDGNPDLRTGLKIRHSARPSADPDAGLPSAAVLTLCYPKPRRRRTTKSRKSQQGFENAGPAREGADNTVSKGLDLPEYCARAAGASRRCSGSGLRRSTGSARAASCPGAPGGISRGPHPPGRPAPLPARPDSNQPGAVHQASTGCNRELGLLFGSANVP